MEKISKEALRVPRIKKHVQEAISYFCMAAALLAAVAAFFLTAKLTLWLRLALVLVLLGAMGACLAGGLRIWKKTVTEAQRIPSTSHHKKKK